MLLKEVISFLIQELTACGIEENEAASMARLLLSQKLALPLSRLRREQQREIDPALYLPELRRLKEGEPLQYVLGETEFMGLTVTCSPAALIPRGDSEVVAEAAIELMKGTKCPLIADICTGSGAYALALAYYLPQAAITATDLSPAALDLAKSNAQALGLQDRIRFYQGDLLQPLLAEEHRYHLIVSNPPYISQEDMKHLPPTVYREPRMALEGGADGLDFYRRLAADICRLLLPDGLLVLEHGWDQSTAVQSIMEAAGLETLQVIRDYGQRDRGLICRMAKEKRG